MHGQIQTLGACTGAASWLQASLYRSSMGMGLVCAVGFAVALGLCIPTPPPSSISPPLFFPMERWEQDKQETLTSVSPATELGGSQDMHLDGELGSSSRSCVSGSIIGQKCVSIPRFILSSACTLIQLEHSQVTYPFIGEHGQGQSSGGAGGAGGCQMSRPHWAGSPYPPTGPCAVQCPTPGGGPSTAPSRPSWPRPLQPSGVLQEWWGRMGKKRGKHRRRAEEEWGALPVPPSSACSSQPSSRGCLPCFMCLSFTRKTRCQSGFESLLLPQVGKTRTNAEAVRRGDALAQHPRVDKTLPHLLLLPNASCRAAWVCA